MSSTKFEPYMWSNMLAQVLKTIYSHSNNFEFTTFLIFKMDSQVRWKSNPLNSVSLLSGPQRRDDLLPGHCCYLATSPADTLSLNGFDVQESTSISVKPDGCQKVQVKLLRGSNTIGRCQYGRNGAEPLCGVRWSCVRRLARRREADGSGMGHFSNHFWAGKEKDQG